MNRYRLMLVIWPLIVGGLLYSKWAVVQPWLADHPERAISIAGTLVAKDAASGRAIDRYMCLIASGQQVAACIPYAYCSRAQSFKNAVLAGSAATMSARGTAVDGRLWSLVVDGERVCDTADVQKQVKENAVGKVLIYMGLLVFGLGIIWWERRKMQKQQLANIGIKLP